MDMNQMNMNKMTLSRATFDGNKDNHQQLSNNNNNRSPLTGVSTADRGLSTASAVNQADLERAQLEIL